MRRGRLLILGVWWLSAGLLSAQSLPADKPQEAKPAADSKSAENPPESKAAESKKPAEGSMQPSTASSESAEGLPAHRTWARVEYLLWWLKDAPLPVPLVTTGNPRVGFDPNFVNTVNTAGALGQPGTQVLFGDRSIQSQGFSGMRLTLGGWVDPGEFFGIEGSAFVLERRTKRFAAGSDMAGNPPLYFPIFSAVAGAERGIPIADPLRGFSGDVIVNSTLQLWGAECNGVFTLVRNSAWDVTLLAGFRYADLRESLQIYNTTTDLIFSNVTNLTDLFSTTNQFYGGQIGGRLAFQHDCWSLDVTGKVALGATHEVVDIQGAITQLGPNPIAPPGLGTFPGGLFAQPSNIGKRRSDGFTVLPSLELKLGYDIDPRTRVFVGYDLMYWSEVVRPGDQINHSVNLTQSPVLGTGRLVGPAQPAPLFNHSDFWAQGINVGLEVRY
jgi:Putative beta barrel porin-7 (BBP7)